MATAQQITPEQLAALFPRASKATLAANAADLALQPAVVSPNETSKVKQLRGAKRMNRTESEYALILEAMKRKGEIHDFKFEGLTIRLADNCRYTPDFHLTVSVNPLVIRFVETKGKHIWDDSKVKFKMAKELCRDWASFEMMQKTKSGWQRIL